MKIKITEYFPGAEIPADMSVDSKSAAMAMDSLSSSERHAGGATTLFLTDGGDTRGDQPFGVLAPSPALPESHGVVEGQKLYIIQRVNGNGGNGKVDGIEGGHRHTLEESDRVKKNSVHRYFLRRAKEDKKEEASHSQQGIDHICFITTMTHRPWLTEEKAGANEAILQKSHWRGPRDRQQAF